MPTTYANLVLRFTAIYPAKGQYHWTAWDRDGNKFVGAVHSPAAGEWLSVLTAVNGEFVGSSQEIKKGTLRKEAVAMSIIQHTA